MAEYTVRLVIQGDDKASGPIGQVNNSLGQMGNVMGGILGADMINRLVSGLWDLGKAGYESVASTEGLSKSIQSLVARELLQTGAAKSMAEAQGLAGAKAAELVKWNEQLADISPFTQDDISDAFNLALAYGYTTDQAKRLTETTANWAAGMNKSGYEMQIVMRALGQMRQGTKLMGGDIMQLSQAGVGVWEILSKAFGKSTDELKKMNEDGLIPVDAAIEAIAKSIEGDFAGAMANAQNSLDGITSTLQDTANRSLRYLFGPLFEGLKPYLIQLTELLKSEEFTAKLKDMGSSLASFAISAIEAIKGMVEWWIKLDQPTKDFLLFLGGVVLIGPPVVQVLTGIVTAFSVLPGVLTAAQAGLTAWRAGMTLTTALGAAGLAPIAITVGAIAAMVASVAAVWYTWNVQIDQTVKKGTESVKNAWAGFFDKQIASGNSARAVLGEYAARQRDVNATLEEAGPIIRAFMGDTAALAKDEEGLANALAMVSESYDEYQAVMTDAGLATRVLNEEQFNAIRSQEDLQNATKGATDSLGEQTGVLSQLTPEMILAQQEAAKLAEEQEKQAKASREASKNWGDLAMSLKDATEAEIARTAIQQLSQALDAGKISPQQYAAAIQDIGKAYGLMNDKSIALAASFPQFTALLEQGKIPADRMSEALAMMNQMAATGNVDFQKILETYGQFPTSLNDTSDAFTTTGNNIVTTADNTAIKSNQAIRDKDWYGTGEKMGSDVATGMTNTNWSGMVATIGDTIVAGLFGLAGQLGDAGEALGKAIDDGMVTGIQNNAQSVIDAAKKVAQDALAAASGTLDINSPSGKFRDVIGKNSMLGWALGIRQNAEYPIEASRETAIQTLPQGLEVPNLAEPVRQPAQEKTKSPQIHFHGPVTFEIKHKQTMTDWMQEMQAAGA